MLHIKKAKLKITLLSATFIVFSLLGSFFVSPHKASAITQAECTAQGGTWVQTYGNLNTYPCSFSVKNYSATDQIKSYDYYYALSYCGNGGNFGNDNWAQTISAADASTPSKWPGTKGISVGYLIDPQDGILGCNEMIDGALSLWGYTASDYESLLTSFGYTKKTNVTCSFTGTSAGAGNPSTCGVETTSVTWTRGNNTRASFQATIKNHIYSGQDPTLDTGLLYYQAQKHLEMASACNATPYKRVSELTAAEKAIYKNNNPVVSGSVGGAVSNDYLIVRLVDGTSWKAEDWVYKISSSNWSKNIELNQQTNGSDGNSTSCANLANAIKGYADTIAADAAAILLASGDPATKYGSIIATPGTAGTASGSGAAGSTDGVETCNVAGVGWIVCPAALFIGKITDGAYTVVESLLVFTIPNAFDTSSANGIYGIWSNVRNLANVAFIFAFFAIIFSQATSLGIGSYGIKKMLPRLIISAILVNLSYYLCVFAIDVSNILGAGIDGILKSALNGISSGVQPGFNWSSVIANALIGVGTVGGAVALVTIPTAGSAILGAAIMFGIAALAAIVTALVVLVARQAILVILIVLAPLAFVAYILPNTENLFDKWKKALTTMLVFYPLVAIVFAGSQVAAAVVRIGSESGLVDIISLAIQAFPLFALPTLMKFSGGLLGKIAGIVNNPNKGPFDAMRKKAQESTDFRKARSTEEAMKGNRNKYANRWARRSARTVAEHGAVKERLNESTNAYTNSLLQPGEDGLPKDPKFASKMAGLNRKETKAQTDYNTAQRSFHRLDPTLPQTIREGEWASQDRALGYENNVPGTQSRIAKGIAADAEYTPVRTVLSNATDRVGEINLNKVVKVMARGQAVVDEIESKDLKAAQILQTQLRMNGANYKDILKQEIGTTVRGMNGESIIVTEAAKAAAGATMLSQGREVSTVMKSVAKLKDKSLRSFLVGQIGANFSTIKGRQAGMVNENFQQAIIDGTLDTDTAYDEARIIATGKNVVQLNRQQYASQEPDSVEYIQKAIETKRVDPKLVDQLRQFSREAVLEPQINQYVPQAANTWHMQIAGLDTTTLNGSGQGARQTSAPTGTPAAAPQTSPAQSSSATTAPSAPAASQTAFGQQSQPGEALSPRTDRALRNMFEHFSNQDIVGMGAGGVNITINNAGGVSGLSNRDVNKIVDALGSAGVRTPEQEQLFETLSSESLRRQQQGISDEPLTPENPSTSGQI